MVLDKLNPEFLQKLEYYCAYQDRCKQEVVQKCRKLGISNEQIEAYIVRLEEDQFIDEQRFAISFARGKHLYKKWGKIKIKYYLKNKRIASRLIDMALKEIDKDYYATFYALATKKWEELPDTTQKSKEKWMGYLQRRGYESHLIYELLNDLSK